MNTNQQGNEKLVVEFIKMVEGRKKRQRWIWHGGLGVGAGCGLYYWRKKNSIAFAKKPGRTIELQ